LIDVDNQCALETAMRYMLENRNKYDNGKISRFAWERFSPEVVVGKLIELYGDVLADTAAHEKESHDN
jgi:glycosyltransferase involved in cell wall biosynthesis